MADNYSDKAKVWIERVYRPANSELSDRLIGKHTPVGELCLKMLSCFSGCRNLDDVFTTYAIEYHGDMDDMPQFHNICNLGFYEVKDKPVTPDWFVLAIPLYGLRYVYFPNFRRAAEYAAQITLHNHMKGVLEYADTGLDWKSIFESQLACAWVGVRWYELGGELQPALASVMECFSSIESSGFQRLDDFALNTLLAPNGDHSLRDEYQQFFRQAPDADSLKRF